MTYNGKVKIALLCFVMITASLVLPSPGMADPLAEHRINISFDLAKHKIFGKVDAIFPEHLRGITVGRGLQVTKLVINHKSEKIRVKDGRIALPSREGSMQIEMEYEGIFSNKEGDSLANTIGKEGVFLLSDWFPAAEVELARFSLQAMVPADFQAVSEAEDMIIKDMGEQKLITFNFPHPVTNIHFIMAPYVVNKDHHGGVQLETYLLPEDQSLSSRYLEASKKYVEMYEEMLGPFPFKRFAVVENILPTGYGMPTFTLLGREVLKLPFIPETSLGHEILHSWFGNSVYIDYGKGNWSEGLTTFLADHYYEELRGNGWQYRKGIMENFESYVHGENEISIKDFVSGDDRSLRAVGYGKTAMVFNMLHNRVGDKAFREALRQLVAKQRFHLTSWQDLETIFSETGGEDLGGFLAFWLNNKGAMAIHLDKIRLNQAKEGYTLEFNIQVSNSPMPVLIPLVILTEGKEEKKILSLWNTRQTFSLSVTDIVEEIIVDPDYQLFRTLKPPETRAVLSRLLGDPTRTVVLPEGNLDVYEPLVQALESRGFEKLPADKVDHSTLARKSLLFLGDHSKHEFLFPRLGEIKSGFSLVIRKNNFNPNFMVGLVVAENSEEVKGVINKLFHYGKYSTLNFSGGRIVVKETESSDRGMKYGVDGPVKGIATVNVIPLAEIISQVADKKIVYVGEKHDRYGDHLIQLEIIRGLRQRYPKLAIGMEMFQRRYQEALDEYISGKTDTQTFLKRSHYLNTWRFNYHLYEDILDYAREHKIAVVALNQEHELVSKVANQGLEQLTQEEKERVPKEMVFDDKPYEKRLRGVFEMHQTELAGKKTPQVFEYFHQAQILWDETMAETIVSFLKNSPDFHLVVLAGNGHLAYGSGIPKRAYRRTAEDYAIILPEPGELPEPDMADFIVFPSNLEAPAEAKLGVVLDTSGEQFEVADLVQGSGAQKAGVEKGDIFLALDGVRVKDLDDIRASLAIKYVGDTVKVKVRRDETQLELIVELGTPGR